MQANKVAEVQMTQISCRQCGIIFYVPETWRWERESNGSTFYCPNGHPRCYRKSHLDEMKEQLLQEKERHKATLSRLNEALAAEDSARKEIKRAKRRAAAGVCPYCRRTFPQLSRHMSAKHPNFAESSAPRTSLERTPEGER